MVEGGLDRFFLRLERKTYRNVMLDGTRVLGTSIMHTLGHLVINAWLG